MGGNWFFGYVGEINSIFDGGLLLQENSPDPEIFMIIEWHNFLSVSKVGWKLLQKGKGSTVSTTWSKDLV